MPALLLPLSKLAQGASRPFDGPPPREGEIAGSFWAASWHKNPPVKSRRPAHAVRNPWYRAQPKPSDHSLDLTAPHNLLRNAILGVASAPQTSRRAALSLSLSQEGRGEIEQSAEAVYFFIAADLFFTAKACGLGERHRASPLRMAQSPVPGRNRSACEDFFLAKT